MVVNTLGNNEDIATVAVAVSKLGATIETALSPLGLSGAGRAIILGLCGHDKVLTLVTATTRAAVNGGRITSVPDASVLDFAVDIALIAHGIFTALCCASGIYADRQHGERKPDCCLIMKYI